MRRPPFRDKGATDSPCDTVATNIYITLFCSLFQLPLIITILVIIAPDRRLFSSPDSYLLWEPARAIIRIIYNQRERRILDHPVDSSDFYRNSNQYNRYVTEPFNGTLTL